MHKLKRVYLLIGLATVFIALMDLFYITINQDDVVLNFQFYMRIGIMISTFAIGIRLILRIDKIFVDKFIEKKLSDSQKKVMEDYREISMEKHEISRKLQIIQSYVKMKRYDELDVFLSRDMNEE